jgi:hypothetical protein
MSWIHSRLHRVDVTPPEAFDRLEMAASDLRRDLVQHPLYETVNSLDRLQVFMQHHVFAVWDFMSLVKRLQRDMTILDHPWTPPLDPICARLINDIVLGEETDEVADHAFISHYELYLLAMDELGADSSAVRDLVERIQRGEDPAGALAVNPIAGGTRRFTETTLDVAHQPTHVVAANFLFGREDVIPEMFERILWTMDSQDAPDVRLARRVGRWRREWWPENVPAPLRRRLPRAVRRVARALEDSREDPRFFFRLYLERHIELDSGHHGPMARRLLGTLCGHDEQKWAEATEAARDALQARIGLWDSVLEAMDDGTANRASTPASARPVSRSAREHESWRRTQDAPGLV